MTGHAFDFHGTRFEARPSGALWWPEGRWLIVADLHLGKSERMARRGGPLLPPYEGLLTMARLSEEVGRLEPDRVISLGDAFDDPAAVTGLEPDLVASIHALARNRDWVWIGGNHDPDTPMNMPGIGAPALQLGNVMLRHAAVAGAGPDVSGHYHPVVRLAGERRRAFLIGSDHLVLPAFGAYTGGLDSTDAALRVLVPKGLAVACGRTITVLPVTPARPWSAQRRNWGFR